MLAAIFSSLILLVPAESFAAGALHFLGICGICGGLLPWLWVTRVEGRGAEAMGLRRQGLFQARLLSLLAGGALFARLLAEVDLTAVDSVYLALGSYSLLVGGLFELYLYFGFIHLRLDRAFGPIPAIVGTAAIYALWHLGTELPMHPDPWPGLLMLFCVGLMFHGFFQITRHAASIWPFSFLGGVWLDFGAHLGFPPEIARAPEWVSAGAALLLIVPVVLLWPRSGRAAAATA